MKPEDIEAIRKRWGLDTLQEGHSVLVTGTTYQLAPFEVVALPAMIATVYPEGHEEYDNIKVWPLDDNDPQLPKGHDSKLWFSRSKATFVIQHSEEARDVLSLIAEMNRLREVIGHSLSNLLSSIAKENDAPASSERHLSKAISDLAKNTEYKPQSEELRGILKDAIEIANA